MPQPPHAPVVANLADAGAVIRIPSAGPTPTTADGGSMIGDTVGDAFGYGGLGAVGTGARMGGGEGTIGIGMLGTIGHGHAIGVDGASRGASLRSPGPLRVVTAMPEVTGSLSPDVVRRVARLDLAHVQRCHEQGRSQDPRATGRIAVRYVIGGSGTVVGATVASSTYPVASAGQCIVSAIRRWQFPSPHGGGVVLVNEAFSLE